MRFISLFVASLFFASGLAQRRPGGFPTPSPLPEGERCLFGGLVPPAPCEEGLTCVISDFGFIAVDLPASGVCTRLESPPAECSVPVCSATGADTICTAAPFVTTCGVWAAGGDGAPPGPVCPEICPLGCPEDMPVASNGQEFCNLCFLQGASCDSGFEIFGPVESEPCTPPISIIDQAMCCTTRGIGCLPRGARCSTLGSRIPPIPCEEGLTCVIDDFGFPAADRPNSGTCQKLDDIQSCTVALCASKGPGFACKVPLPINSGIVSTCKAWATRTDGNPKPDCNLRCPEFCPISFRPVASNGERFCNVCALFQASCEADFMFFGPVRRQVKS